MQQSNTLPAPPITVDFEYAVQQLGLLYAAAVAVKDAHGKVAEANSKLSAVNREIEEREQRLHDVISRIAECNATLSEKRAELDEVERQLADVRSQREQEQARLHDIKAEVARLEERFVRK